MILSKSLFKRRLGIEPRALDSGRSWISSSARSRSHGPGSRSAGRGVAVILAITFAGDIVVNQFRYWLGIRETKW